MRAFVCAASLLAGCGPLPRPGDSSHDIEVERTVCITATTVVRIKRDVDPEAPPPERRRAERCEK